MVRILPLQAGCKIETNTVSWELSTEQAWELYISLEGHLKRQFKGINDFNLVKTEKVKKY